MLKDVTQVIPLEDQRLQLIFEDGVEGIADLNSIVHFRGVFELLRDPDFFRQVRIDPELGTVVWPNGADIDPDVLYASVSGIPITLDV